MLWYEYEKLQERFPDSFAMQQIADPGDIYPVFRQLFERKAAVSDDRTSDAHGRTTPGHADLDRLGMDLRTDRALSRGNPPSCAEEFGLDTYPNQIEVISAEQMMDAYSSVGMPVGYHHWSFGKQFLNTSSATSAGRWGWPTRSSSTPTPVSPTSWKRTP